MQSPVLPSWAPSEGENDPTIPLLGKYPKETVIKKDTCAPMFITALFTIARTWKQPRCPSRGEWIKKMWYIHKMEYYSDVKRNASEVDKPRTYDTEWGKSEREKQTSHMNTYMESKRWDGWSYLQGSKGDTDIKNRTLDTVGEEEDGMILREQHWKVYVSKWKLDSQWECAVCLRKP